MLYVFPRNPTSFRSHCFRVAPDHSDLSRRISWNILVRFRNKSSSIISEFYFITSQLLAQQHISIWSRYRKEHFDLRYSLRT